MGEDFEYDICEYNTYNDWRILGFQVKKGEKSTTKNNDGVALFSNEQVYNINGLLFNLNSNVMKYKSIIDVIKNNKIINILIKFNILDKNMFNYE
jgi:hypothetical protein